MLGQSVLFIAIAGLGIACRDKSPHPILSALGLVLLAVSVIWGISGVAALGRGLTPFPKPGAEARLVQRGIYGFSRHPLYVAVFCAGLGAPLLLHSWPTVIVSLLLGPFFDAKARG